MELKIVFVGCVTFSRVTFLKSLYGFKEVHKLEYPTMSLSSRGIDGLVGKISSVFNKVQPETVYTLNRSDVHSDHQIIFQAVMACTKSLRNPF